MHPPVDVAACVLHCRSATLAQNMHAWSHPLASAMLYVQRRLQRCPSTLLLCLPFCAMQSRLKSEKVLCDSASSIQHVTPKENEPEIVQASSYPVMWMVNELATKGSLQASLLAKCCSYCPPYNAALPNAIQYLYDGLQEVAGFPVPAAPEFAPKPL